MASKCRSCEAPVRWAWWRKSGKAVALDVEPHAEGTLVLIGDYVDFVKEEDRRLLRSLYRVHFTTCPNAKEWRKA